MYTQHQYTTNRIPIQKTVFYLYAIAYIAIYIYVY